MGVNDFMISSMEKKRIVETDHKPLIYLSKILGDMPPRLQRFFIHLMKYDYEFQYMFLANNCFSRIHFQERRSKKKTKPNLTKTKTLKLMQSPCFQF